MSTQPHALSALAAAALAAASLAHAAPSSEDFKQVRLYGDVTIAEDSSAVWGPWEQFEPPAAGAPTLLAMPSFRGEPYRPLPQAESDVRILGFGGIYDDAYLMEYEGSERAEYIRHSPTHSVALTGSVLQENRDQPLLPQQLSLSTTMLSTGQALFPDSGALTLYTGEGVGYFRMLETDTGGEYVQYTATTATEPYFDPTEVQATFYRYYAGKLDRESQSEQGGWGVIGHATPTADLSALRADGKVATYSGYSVDRENYATPISLEVNFGNATFTGSLNGGRNGNSPSTGHVHYRTTSAGIAAYGNVGVNFSGDVRGASLIATAASATDGTVDSFNIRGALYGPQAAAAGGVIDVTKTIKAPPSAATPTIQSRHIGAFLAVQQRPR